MLPDMWNMATNISAVLKSKNSRATGRKTVKEPKPAMVPTPSADRAAMKKRFPDMASQIYLRAVFKLILIKSCKFPF
jgi:hypothetical protein